MGVETFYKEFAKKEGFGIRIRMSKKAPRSDNVTSCIYVCCCEGQCKTKNTFDSGESKDDEKKTTLVIIIYIYIYISHVSNLLIPSYFF